MAQRLLLPGTHATGACTRLRRAGHRFLHLAAPVHCTFAAEGDFRRRRGQNPDNHLLHGSSHERGQRPGRRKQPPDDGKQAAARPRCISEMENK